ncbi:MAG: universal stress protein [Streptomyces sp.]|uniref:universal stress protein n=1 Tax=Streptomyces sp. TaxID=1931 RepID=UPI003D6BD91A
MLRRKPDAEAGTMFDTVTVGLDGTRESQAAVDWAAREALSRGATLQLVQIHETGAYPYSPIAQDHVEHEWAHKITSEAVDDLAGRHPGLRTTVELEAGRPSYVLSDFSTRTDLLVLGSRGLGSVLGYIVGSTALPTVAHAQCPVILVRAPESEEPGLHDHAPAAEGGIVLGLDLGRPCDELLAFTFDAAARRSAPLRVLHSWGHHPPAHGTRPALDAEHARQEAEQETELSAALRPWREKYPALEVHAEALTGRPARLLVDAASGASMVVVGRRIRRSLVGWHLGPVAHAVMHHARTPVAVVAHD